jgi:hypothetical protein
MPLNGQIKRPLLKSQKKGISVLDDTNDVGAKRAIFKNFTRRKILNNELTTM